MIKLVKKHLTGYKFKACAGLFFKLIEAVIELFVPLIVASIIDEGIKLNDINFVWTRGALLLGLFVGGFLASATCQYYAAVSAFGYGKNLRKALFVHINAMPLHLIDSFGASTLTSRINIDAANTQTVVNRFIRLVTRSPLILAGALIMAIRINAKLSLIFFAASLLIAVTLYFVLFLSAKRHRQINKSQDEITLLARENLAGLKMVRAYGKENDAQEAFNKSAKKHMSESILLGVFSAFTNPLTYLIVNSAIIAVLYFGGLTVNIGGLTQGEIIALVNYLLQIQNALVIIASLTVIFSRGITSAKRINEVLDTQLLEKVEADYEEIDTGEAIVFKNVSMTYPAHSKPTLESISFSLSEGQSLGITGSTASGKSSLISIICALYDYEGEIYLFGKNLKSFSDEDLRAMLGVAPQKAALLSGTIRENMLLSKKDATDEEIMSSLKAAQVDFISSHDVAVTRGGGNFSGGQRQRLSIARALIKDPKILILDDCMSALDYSTEASLRKQLQKMKGSTKIIVSQRLLSIKNCDKILVLDQGKIAGFGSHKQLIKSCGIYRETATIQECV